MSGVSIAGVLLREYQPLLAVVSATGIRAWQLPQGSPLPAIVVTRISRTERQFLAAQAVRLVTERVQVTVRAANGLEREKILKLARAACADQIGAIGGFTGVSVLLAGTGPDFMDDAASIFMGSTDLRISFNELA